MKKKLSPELAAYLLPLHERYISLRQASEWGMRASQETFSILKSRLISDAEKRRKIIFSVIIFSDARDHVDRQVELEKHVVHNGFPQTAYYPRRRKDCTL